MVHRLSTQRKFLQSLEAMLLILLVSAFLPPQASSSSKHQFSMTRSISSDPLEFQLKLAFEVTIRTPEQMDLGKSDDVRVDVEGAVSEVHYEELTLGTPGDKSFWAPIGESSRMYVTSFFGGIFYYFEFDTAVSANMTVVGNGTLSVKSVGWNSAGTESFTVTHIGNSEETLEIQMRFKYVALLTIWKANEQGYFIAKEPHVISGITPLVSEHIQVVQPSVDNSHVWFVAAFVLVLSVVSTYYMIRRKKKEKLMQPKEDYIWLTDTNDCEERALAKYS